MTGVADTVPLLRVTGLCKHYAPSARIGRRSSGVRAVDGVDLSVEAGETVAIVGESGCGKSTLARTALKLTEPTAGRIEFDGRDVTGFSPRRMTPLRRDMQIVFQDSSAALNPRRTVAGILAEPYAIQRVDPPGGRAAAIAGLLDQVGLPAAHADRHPAELSGGERQRVAIARALALRPRLVVLDEPVSAVDTSIQAQILALLAELKASAGLTYLLISHDLAVVAAMADRIAVMKSGRFVEVGTRDEVVTAPKHAYTRLLLDSVPIDHPRDRGKRRTSRESPAAVGDPTGAADGPD